MYRSKLFLVAIISSSLLFSACNGSLLGGGEPPAVPNEAPNPPAPIVVDGIRTSYSDVVEKTSAAVVQIITDQKLEETQPGQFPFEEFFNQNPGPRRNSPQQQPRGIGSGVIVSVDGTILTNAHVVDSAEKITVQLTDNKTYVAKLVGSDKPSDLAVLKIEAQNLPYLALGNSDDVRVGDIVLAIGNPLGIGQSVTQGIISAKGRHTGLSDGSFADFLQTDAPINRGNSGGALVNLNGELIGINSQILSTNGGSIGIGFSIPTNMAKSVMEQLLKDGKVRRGMLGINIQDLTADIAESLQIKEISGILVNNVKAGSAAEKAGIKVRDVITHINGEKMQDTNSLRIKIAGTMPGTAVKVTVMRDGQSQELTATLDEFDDPNTPKDSDQTKTDETPKSGTGKLGVTLQPLTPDLAKRVNAPGGASGMVVVAVENMSPAARAGINEGDVIIEINKQIVTTAQEVQEALDKAGDKPLLLLVSRQGQTIFLTIKGD